MDIEKLRRKFKTDPNPELANQLRIAEWRCDQPLIGRWAERDHLLLRSGNKVRDSYFVAACGMCFLGPPIYMANSSVDKLNCKNCLTIFNGK